MTYKIKNEKLMTEENNYYQDDIMFTEKRVNFYHINHFSLTFKVTRVEE